MMQCKIKEQAQKKHTVITKIWKSSEASVLGRYNTPPLQEDLVPRSRMAPEINGTEVVLALPGGFSVGMVRPLHFEEFD